MKKSFVLLTMVAATITSFQSCKKEEKHQPPIITNVNKTLIVNESCTFTLPANTAKAPYRIIAQASHYSVSMVSKDAMGNETYLYTPALNYTGTDNVAVANTKEEQCTTGNGGHCGGGHHHGHCDDDEQQNIVVFNFTIGNTSNSSNL